MSNPVPSNQLSDLQRNIQDIDRVVNQTSGTVTNRTGTQITPIPAIVAGVQSAANAAIPAINADVNTVDAAKNTAVNATIPAIVATVQSDANTAINTEIPALVGAVDASRIAGQAEMSADVAAVDIAADNALDEINTAAQQIPEAIKLIGGDWQFRTDIETIPQAGLVAGNRATDLDSGLQYQWAFYEGTSNGFWLPFLAGWGAPSHQNLPGRNGPSRHVAADIDMGGGLSLGDFDGLPRVMPKKLAPKRATFALLNNITDQVILVPSASGNNHALVEISNKYNQAENSTNIGGYGGWRVTRTYLVAAATAATLNALSQSAGVTTSTVDSAQYRTAMYTPPGSMISGGGNRSNGPIDFNARSAYNLPANDSVVFPSGRDGNVLIWPSPSNRLRVQVLRGGAWETVVSVDPSLATEPFLAFYNYSDGQVRLLNEPPNGQTAIVVGIDFDRLGDTAPHRKYDNIQYWRYKNVEGTFAWWIGNSTGANDMAWKDAVTGRFFGSFHGGISDEVLKIYADGVEVPQPFSNTGFSHGATISVETTSTLSSDVQDYDFYQNAVISDGGYSININCWGEEAVPMLEMNAGMTIASKRFSKISYPVNIDCDPLATSQVVKIGDVVDSVIQLDPVLGHRIETSLTQFDNRYAEQPRGGVYVQVRNSDNKIYCNPLRNSGMLSRGASFGVAHTFYS